MSALRRAGQQWQTWLHDIGNFQSRALLTVFYFTVLMPFAVITRFALDPLGRRPRSRASAWRPWTDRPTDLEAARREF